MPASKKAPNKRKAADVVEPPLAVEDSLSEEGEEEGEENEDVSDEAPSDTEMDTADTDGVVQKKGSKRSKGSKNASRRAYGYRKLSRLAGYIPMSSEAASGKDPMHFLVSPHDVQRCMRYIPAGRGHSYSEGELALRKELLSESITPKALQEAQVRMDAVLRRVMNSCVKNIVDTGRLRVSASVMSGVLDPFRKGGEFTAVTPPEGVLMEATRKGVIRDTGKFDNIQVLPNDGASTDSARVAGRAQNLANLKATEAKLKKSALRA